MKPLTKRDGSVRLPGDAGAVASLALAKAEAHGATDKVKAGNAVRAARKRVVDAFGPEEARRIEASLNASSLDQRAISAAHESVRLWSCSARWKRSTPAQRVRRPLPSAAMTALAHGSSRLRALAGALLDDGARTLDHDTLRLAATLHRKRSSRDRERS